MKSWGRQKEKAEESRGRRRRAHQDRRGQIPEGLFSGPVLAEMGEDVEGMIDRDPQHHRAHTQGDRREAIQEKGEDPDGQPRSQDHRQKDQNESPHLPEEKSDQKQEGDRRDADRQIDIRLDLFRIRHGDRRTPEIGGLNPFSTLVGLLGQAVDPMDQFRIVSAFIGRMSGLEKKEQVPMGRIHDPPLMKPEPFSEAEFLQIFQRHGGHPHRIPQNELLHKGAPRGHQGPIMLLHPLFDDRGAGQGIDPLVIRFFQEDGKPLMKRVEDRPHGGIGNLVTDPFQQRGIEAFPDGRHQAVAESDELFGIPFRLIPGEPHMENDLIGDLRAAERLLHIAPHFLLGRHHLGYILLETELGPEV